MKMLDNAYIPFLFHIDNFEQECKPAKLNHLLNSKVKKLKNDRAAHLVIFLEIWQCSLYNPRISLLLSIPKQASEYAIIACVEL